MTNPEFDKKFGEECGIVGVYDPNGDVSRLAFYGIYALQHRGQESAGIASADGHKIKLRTGMGLVTHVFKDEDLDYLTGDIAIGHTRYSTTGTSNIKNAQPIVVDGGNFKLAIAHNGNVVNSLELKREMEELGYDFNTSSDSEVIAKIVSNAPASTWEGRIAYLMRKVQGAYSLTLMTEKELIAVRDPLGVRPLCFGKVNGGWIIASESCALDNVGAKYVREVNPGEAIIFDSQGYKSIYQKDMEKCSFCVFEHIYFARPDSEIDGKLVYKSRLLMGKELAREHPVEADMVIGVPDSATASAVGYSEESGIPFGEGLVKNRYVGRTFINPDQRMREVGVKVKLNPLRELIQGKRLVVVDDSIVRGTTSKPVVSLLRNAGASEIHLRICAPPIKFPCHFGVDFPTRKELIAANNSIDEIKDTIEADSLGYLSHAGLLKAVKAEESNVCMGCFTGNHPIPVQLEMDKLSLEV
ncbi:MAG: amidophosphoribosyltransferase [SAR202 cluster bacterium]|nr:amidophosphoribosyltransferase [SAR202 cluster bacterium]|tara:strand:+ start:447 stop:1856 length:1410 start_codon:yes stop_codon:yes gene_type:complete